MRKLGILIFVLFIAFGSKAQLEVGVFGGGSFYMGDLNPNKPFQMSKLAYGFLGRYNLNSRWAIKLNVYKGVLNADDDVSNYITGRSLEFKSSLWEVGAVGEFNFLQYFTGSAKDYFTPYIFGGIAMVYNRPKVGLSTLRDFGTEGQDYSAYINYEDRPEYSFFNFAIPFGLGIKYSFSKRIAATIEWGMRKTFTDYLDDVSTTYYLPSNLDPTHSEYDDQAYSDPNRTHEPYMQRGNSETKDWYSFFGLTLTYNINLLNRNKCSQFEERF